MARILKYENDERFFGCDFVLELGEERRNTKIELLQITDMQFIDASQRRTPDRLRIDEINAWNPKNFDVHCANQIRTLLTQCSPDLIFITGDAVYGSFDDSGSAFLWFVQFMDSLGIPWALTFGNHDNESLRGVDWQCEVLEKAKNALFKRGNVTGNSNYSIGISVGGELVRMIYMTDSNGCKASADPKVEKRAGIYPDQLDKIRENARLAEKKSSSKVPAFMAFHIPTSDYLDIEAEKGYRTREREFYTIGVDTPQKDKDFGCRKEKMSTMPKIDGFRDFLKDVNVDGIFCGHCHGINTVITHSDIKWVFGLKTGQYDYHIPGQLGGTLVTLEGADFTVRHLPSLAPLSPYPGGAKMFCGFFAEDKVIL